MIILNKTPTMKEGWGHADRELEFNHQPLSYLLRSHGLLLQPVHGEYASPLCHSHPQHIPKPVDLDCQVPGLSS